jgi:hypothetical protein
MPLARVADQALVAAGMMAGMDGESLGSVGVIIFGAPLKDNAEACLSSRCPCPVPVIVVPRAHFHVRKAILGLPALVGKESR